MNSRDAGRASVIGMLIAAAGAIIVSINYPNVMTANPYMQPPPPPPPMPEPVRTPQPVPPPTFVPPVPTSTDVTLPPQTHIQKDNPVFSFPPNDNTGPATAGISVLNGAQPFPSVDQLGGPKDFLLFQSKPGSIFTKLSDYAYFLQEGDAMGSVRPPSKTGMITFEWGAAACGAPADMYVHVDHSHSTTCRVINMSGKGDKVKVQLKKEIVGDHPVSAFAIAPGFELVCCEHKLTREQLRPNDGFARRRVQVMGDEQNIAISEVSIESILNSSELIAKMNTEDNAKDKRVLKDLSRMAAVLNHANGTQGYSK